jgi:glyoxylase-like metal-dependent hydrolase (beta-lactamase superfamily II)
MKNKVFVLKDGYAFTQESGEHRANCSITLIIGSQKNILVDTGLPADKDAIITGLKDHGLGVENIHIVIGTHGHSDHIGNIGLFPHSLIIVSCDICRGDVYYDNDLAKGFSYSLDAGIDVIYTPGHTGRDVSVVVCDTHQGTVVVAGDLFESESDIEDPSRWKDVSENHGIHFESRSRVADLADYVVPGHGPMFRLTERHKELIRLQADYK